MHWIGTGMGIYCVFIFKDDGQPVAVGGASTSTYKAISKKRSPDYIPTAGDIGCFPAF